MCQNIGKPVVSTGKPFVKVEIARFRNTEACNTTLTKPTKYIIDLGENTVSVFALTDKYIIILALLTE